MRIHHVVTIGVPRCSFTRCRRSSKSTRHFFGIYACPGRAHLGQVSTSGFGRSFQEIFETTKKWKQRKCEEELQYVKARTQHPPKPASQKCHKRSCLSPFLLCSIHHWLCIQVRFRGFSLQTSIIRHMLVYTPSYNRDVYILYTIYYIQYHLQENLFFAALHPDIHQLPDIPLIADKQICMHVLLSQVGFLSAPLVGGSSCLAGAENAWERLASSTWCWALDWSG